MATTEEDRKPEATSSSTKEEQLKKPTKPQHQIFAIRKCDSLKAPAIFFAWEDCEFYVDDEENEGVVDFKGFDLVLDAIKWIYRGKNDDSIPKKTMAAIPAASQETKIRPPPSREKTITNVATTQINKAATKVGKPRVPHTQVPAPFPPGWPYQQFHPMMGQVPYPPHAFLPGHVPHPAYPPYPMPNQMGQPGMPGQGMTTTAPKKKTKTAVHPMPNQMRDEKFEESKRYKYDPDMARLSFDEWVEKWQAYKSMHGTDPTKSTHHELGNWMMTQRRRRKSLEDGENTNMTQEQVDRLTELGFPWDTDIVKTKKYEASFDEWVKKWQESKRMRITDPTKSTPQGLEGWMVKQRSKRKRLEDGEHTNLTQEQVDRVTELGFPWDANTRTEKNEAIFDEWVKKWQEYKIMRITDPTKARPQGLGSWIVKQRTKRKSLEDGEHTNMTQEQVDRLTELGFPWEADNYKTEKNEAIFDEWVKKWQESKIMRITDPTKATHHGLGSWIVKQRTKRKSLEDGVPTNLTQEQVDRLTELGFPWDTDIVKTKKNEAIFDEWVKKWQESKGMRITDPTKARPPELGSWIVKQRSKRKSLEDGVPTNMTQEQVDRLTALGFPWDADNSRTEKNEAIFDEWVEKWQAYKSMHGTDPTKVTHHGLGSWIVKQRSKRKSLEDGVHTNMTQEQVDRLTELRFPWDSDRSRVILD
jgi:hypothetical protein